MEKVLFEKAVSILDIVSGSDYQVLDFGCGNGELLGALSRRIGTKSRLVGYDAMEKSIAIAQARYPNADFICERFSEELPFPDASFDLFVTIDTLECIKNKEALLAEIYRVLKPGGEILAMHWDWDTSRWHCSGFDCVIFCREIAVKTDGNISSAVGVGIFVGNRFDFDA